MTRLGRLPLTVRIPLAVSILFLAIAAVLTLLAIHGMSRQVERHIADLGQVYLDGLSAAVLPAARTGDIGQMREAFNRALDTHIGVVDRALAIIDTHGAPAVQVARPVEAGPLPIAQTVALAPSGTQPAASGASIWTWRPLDERDPGLGTVMANLDIDNLLQQRRSLAFELAAVGLAISLIGAGLGFFLARRLQRPIIQLTHHLRSAHRERPRTLNSRAFAQDPELADLLAAYNWMVEGMREREALAGRHARIEREALLGRMSAALAHEVRNPLGGMLTAVQTLRQFGDRPDARRESLDFIERGVQALQAVVNANLRTFRSDEPRQPLRVDDLDDVRLMVQAQASRKSVTVHVARDWAEPATPVLPAAPVRQILLNLVLNAVEASPAGQTVHVVARARAGNLVLHVADHGGGLPAHAKMALGSAGPPGDRMGLDIVQDLVESLNGRIRVRDESGKGTHIAVRLPGRRIDQQQS